MDDEDGLGGRVRQLGYDPRYFSRSAEVLSDMEIDVVEYTPSAAPSFNAVQSFYNLVQAGLIVHDGDPILAAHVAAAAGEKTERGWKVRKLRQSSPIDALMAAVMAVDLARLDDEEPWFASW